MTENVQLRIFPKGDEQRFFEFTLDRAGLLAGRGGLRAVGPDEGQYFGFGENFNNRVDPFGGDKLPEPHRILSSCVACHKAEKLGSINTFGFGLTVGYRGAARTDLAAQVGHTIDLKKKSYTWGLLHGLREAKP